MKVDPPFPHAGPARLAVKSKKSPTEVPLKSIRKPSGACGGFVVAWWWLARVSLRGLKSQGNTPPLSRAWPLATLLRKATFGRATLAYARHNNRGCRESYPQGTLACAFPIGRGVSRRLQVRFSADTRGESRRRSSTLAADFVGALRAVHMPKEKRGGFLPSKLGENLPRFSCPRNPLSVGLTLALSCGRGLTRPVSRQFAPTGRGGALPRIDGGAGRGEVEAGTLKVPRRTDQ